MFSSCSHHLRSNVIGYVALFMAMTGITYAAGLPKDSVKSKQIKDGQVQSADLGLGSVDGSKVAPNSLGGGQLDESTLAQVPAAADADQLGGQSPAAFQQRVGGSCTAGQFAQSIRADGEMGCGADDDVPPNPASGDLAGSYPNPVLATGSISGGAAGEVIDNSITGADVSESTLAQVPSAGNAGTVDGRDAVDLSSARIHAAANNAQQSLFPDLSSILNCEATSVSISFFLTNPATANMMIVGSGTETGSVSGGDINVANGAQTARTTTIPVSGLNRFFIFDSNTTGTAQAEMQIIVESGASTYTIAVHLFHNAANGACEATGTATIAK